MFEYKLNSVTWVQYWKALAPIDVTLVGIVMDVKPEQSKKAPSPIDVTSLVSTIVVITFLVSKAA